MEFQAYPTTVHRKETNFLLRVQSFLHSSDSVLLPCVLLGVGSFLVLYQHLTDDDTGRHSVRNFLAKILISMLPLVLLERAILACADPIGLFGEFSAKVLLMHVCFLGLRMACNLFPDVQVGYTYCNALAFVAGCVMLPWIFRIRFSLQCLREHGDVLCLAAATLLLALLEVVLLGKFKFSNKWTRNMFIEDLILTGSDYIEILAFVPAAWMAWRKKGVVASMDLFNSQRRAVWLFAFLTCFYSVEDLANAYNLRVDFPLAALGHFAHFLLLMDFSTFLLAHLFDPEKFAKLRGAIANWFADVCAV
mmetsp:Transcript_48135/g.111473  ORF Transcript_48135/g.111473 Transcript_48135/m.111473 type:complete len:306 (+) Transcript_48135:60-977(+)|eukprot:CAMPEP_0171092150 /NCGR_PEP_ID=MMETSP0766_2-20121228/35524_1 /TAXON_ID=439317 /ORGANISM="Gambierdiscus australes, Strain CAWD 149" /LENGTH=305 /DNA_ID=CAMNT_0011550351 /DNA_START=60 /DNA_END=977 /DNA_ORIENTATION=-